MTVQISARKNSQSKLDQCVVNEANSDTHVLDVSGLVSGIINYADALRREKLIKRISRKATGPDRATGESRRASPVFRTYAATRSAA